MLQAFLTTNSYENLISNRYLGNHSNDDPIDNEIIKILFGIGIYPHLKGFKYLKTAIKMAIKDPECLDLVTKRLYPDIAKQYHTAPSCVERAIRTAIASIAIADAHYTNKEFIFGIVTCLEAV